MKTKNTYKFAFLMIFMLGFLGMVSANGLQIYNGNQTMTNLTIQKTLGTTKTVQLNITNEEPRTFYNLQFDQSNIISIPKTNISSGQSKIVTATINTDSNFNGNVFLMGYYNTSIGISNKTYIVNVNYPNGFDVCNLQLIQGDSITWHNSGSSQIAIKRLDTNSNIATIDAGNNFTYKFNTPSDFYYEPTLLTLAFGQQCKLNIQSTTGLVHSQNYDFKLPLKVTINYVPTTIETTFLNTNYTINYSSSEQDIFKITNTGTSTAKSIHLSGDWFTFTKNDFDLNAGQSINLGYTIKPSIMNTSQTGKNYEKELKITGNFPTQTQKININIPFANVISQSINKTFDLASWQNLYALVCLSYPAIPQCAIGYYNSSSSDINVTISQDAVKSLLQSYATSNDNQQAFEKNQLEVNIAQTKINNETLSQLSNLTEVVNKLNNSVDGNNSSNMFFVILIIFIVIIIGAMFIWNKNNLRLKSKLNLERGERY